MSKIDNVKGYTKNYINWYPGHMAKAKREISEKLNLIDIVLEVVDARMPLSSKIVDVDDLIEQEQGMTISEIFEKHGLEPIDWRV